MRIVVSMDVPNTVATSLGAHEICDDLRGAVISYVVTAITDFETSRDDPDIGETLDSLDMLISDLRLMKDSIEARAWGFIDKVHDTE